MSTALPDVSTLLNYGRGIGLFAPPPDRAHDTAGMPQEQVAGDIVNLLRREATGDPSLFWADTPFMVLGQSRYPARLAVTTALTTEVTELPSLELGNLIIGSTSALRRFEPTELLLDQWVRLRQPASARFGKPRFDFAPLADRIRAITGLSIKEFAGLLGRSREQYYHWRKGRVTREIEARTAAIAEALTVVESQPAHRVREWLLSENRTPMKLLVAENYHGFIERAGAWVADAAIPKHSRRLTLDEVRAMTADEEASEGPSGRLHALLSRSEAATVAPVRRNPNFYQDLVGSFSDEDE